MLDKIEEVESDKSTLYELLGGDESGIENIRLLVETFYDMMDSSEKATELRAIHAPGLTEAREKLFMFLTGWTVHNCILSSMDTHGCVLGTCPFRLVKQKEINGCFA